MLLTFILFLVGLVALIGGAKLLVLGATQLAITLNISSLIIGLTVVAFGTSAPEIAVCGLAAWRREYGLVIGNIVGSNIFNILLVLGISASLVPLLVKKGLLRWDVPVMIAISLLFWIFAFFGTLYRWEGILLLLCLVAYLLYHFYFEKKESQESLVKGKYSLWVQLVLIAIALCLLGFGSDQLIKSSTAIARFFGIDEFFIGLSFVAIGTSLPELATCLVAIFKGEKDLAVGNVIGSNIFNLLAVGGISALIRPIPVSRGAVFFDIPVMVAVAIATLPIFITGHRISRWEGVLFLFYYVFYLIYLGFEAFAHPLLPLLTTAFFFYILPLTLLTLLIGVIRHVHRHHTSSRSHFKD